MQGSWALTQGPPLFDVIGERVEPPRVSMCITALLLADDHAPRVGPDTWMLFGGQGAVQTPGVLETKEMTLFGYARVSIARAPAPAPYVATTCCAPFPRVA